MQPISLFLRCRPHDTPDDRIRLNVDDGFILFDCARESMNLSEGTRFEGSYSVIFGPQATQDDIYKMVAKPKIIRVMEGYNSTIFAYGQTGSGKTFTVTGGVKSYHERGLIPRCIEEIFANIRMNRTKIYNVCHIPTELHILLRFQYHIWKSTTRSAMICCLFQPIQSFLLEFISQMESRARR